MSFFYKHLMTEVIVGISKMLETTKEIHVENVSLRKG
jgi:hypothetical protein